MKAPKLLFAILLTFSLSTYGQFPEEQLMGCDHLNTTQTAAQDIILLDSMIYNYYPDGPYVRAKTLYDYDALGRKIYQGEYEWDNDTESIYLEYETISSYDGLMVTEIRRADFENTGTLVNHSRTTFSYDTEGKILVRETERWNGDVESWVNYSKQVLDEQTPTYERRFFYLWDETNMEYALSGQFIAEITDNEVISSDYSYDPIDGYLNTRITTIRTHPDLGLQTFYERQIFDVDLWKWYTHNRIEEIFDVPNHKSNKTISRIGNDTQGELFLGDSILIYYNSDWLAVKDTFFRRSYNSSFMLHAAFDYEYDQEGNLLKETVYDYDNNQFVLYEVYDYYYHTVSVGTTEPVELKIHALFPNPMTSDNQILFIWNDNDYSSLDYRLFSSMGQLIDQSLIRNGDVISLSQLNLIPGMYFVNVQGESGMRSWKVVLE